jgi:hypothetical protein
MDNGLFDEADTLAYNKSFDLLSYDVDCHIYLDVEPKVA